MAVTDQESASPAIDPGSMTAAALGPDTRSTQTDSIVDAASVDVGSHY